MAATGALITVALLEVRDLRVGYGAIPVLQGISFDVDEGKTTVLLGLNGAGKTTLFSLITRLYYSASGTIRSVMRK